jgi:HSP20 family protein
MLGEVLPGIWESDEGWFGGELNPSVDLSETDKTVELRMDLPGVEAKDVEIELNNNVLTVKGKREEQKEEKGRTFHRIERRAGSFCRSFALPCAVTEGEAAAGFHDGVLTVTLPKAMEAQTRKIKVKA